MREASPVGRIHQDVLNGHLRLNRGEAPLLDTFLHEFDINFAKQISGHSTTISAYLLKPHSTMGELFGFSSDILLVVSRYRQVEHRTMQTIEKAYQDERIKGRADPLTFFLISEEDDVVSWLASYVIEHRPGRTPIGFTRAHCQANSSDKWFVRNELSRRLFRADFFDDELPINTDTMFFGRSAIVDEHIDAIKKLKNRGIFGLRKTGKTSIQFRIQRLCQENRIAHVVYLDCKRPDLRAMRWTELINYIAEQLDPSIEKSDSGTSKQDPVKRLIAVLQMSQQRQPYCIMFDEIEYISPLAQLDKHWHADFVPFWQTLWSIQSEIRKLCFIVAGVNPYLSEIDSIDHVQNPMFGIVKTSFVKGLASEELAQMTSKLGGRMGLQFDDTAIEYLHKRFGGHPLLTRMACSHVSRQLDASATPRPTVITAEVLRASEEEREAELQFYCRHVVSELKEFYKDEYHLLETLASGEIVDFLELAIPEWIQHLKSYGIIRISGNKKPTFEMPILQRYVSLERARREKRVIPRTFVKTERRAEWFERRKREMLASLKKLQEILHRNHRWLPYNSQFLPEADRLAGTSVCESWPDFVSFCNSMNLALVDPIDTIYGRGTFFTRLKPEYPDLFDALHRIRILRNNVDHLRLNKTVQSALLGYISKDLYGGRFESLPEPWFSLQQIIVEELCAATIYEVENFA